MKTQPVSSKPQQRFIHRGRQFDVPIDQIIRIQAFGNYSIVYFTDHPPVVMAKVLRQYEEMLAPFGFLRTHKSHLVNSRHITGLRQQGEIHLTDASIANVSRRKRGVVTGMLNQLTWTVPCIKRNVFNGVCLAVILFLQTIPSIAQNVGIGTSNPTSKLHVIGNTHSTGNLIAGSRLGVGTSSPFYPLHVISNGDSPLAVFEGDDTNIRFIEIIKGSNVMGLGYQTNHAFISLNTGLPFDIRTANTSRIYVSSVGNIGIGTTFPSEKLQVEGKTRTQQLQVTTGAANGYLLSASDANGNAMWISKDQAGYWTKSDNLVYPTDSNVNIGIGETAPAAKLHVGKSVEGTGANDFLLLENGLGGGVGIRFKNPNLNTNLWQLFLENDGKFKIGRGGLQDYLTILPDGKVGIGTSAPTSLMHLQKNFGSPGANDFLLIENTALGGAGIRFKNATTPTLWQVYIEQTGRFSIGRQGSAEDLTILETGDVGIGTSSPVATLDVDGSIRTKHSGSIVTDIPIIGLQTVNLTIPAVPSGWDFTNTMVLVSHCDGLTVFTIHQAKLTSLTNIQVWCTVSANGPARLNYIIFKL